MLRITVCVLLGFALFIGFTAVNTPPAETVPAPVMLDPATHVETGLGEHLTVKIAVIGTGDELFFWWGHIALIIENTLTGQSHFFDYGVFSFAQENFFMNFAMGRLIYSVAVSPTASNIANYRIDNRDVIIYTLNIPPLKRELIYRQAQTDVGTDYLYHHFRHNCVTPLLYLIDIATERQFSAQFANVDEPGRFTLRQHVRRHTWFSPFIDWGLNFLMGQEIDREITPWEEMFLPSELARNIYNFEFYVEGERQRLVSGREEVFMSEGRPPVLDVPLTQWPRQLVFSLAVALFLGFLFFIQAKKSPAFGQVALGICHSLFGLIFGGAGLMLFFMANFTSHDYTFNNVNLFFASPLLLLAVPLGIRYAFSDNYHKRLRPEFTLRLLWLLVVLGIFASMLVKLTPWFWQDNLTDQLLLLPIALVLSLEPAGLRRMLRRIFWRWL